jgi:hypothetical protein
VRVQVWQRVLLRLVQARVLALVQRLYFAIVPGKNHRRYKTDRRAERLRRIWDKKKNFPYTRIECVD